ncbi:CopG family transcriptional regulator [Kocuria sp. CPCC 205268]|uniref:ribbon-helix-helix domain-containing protein n=1 Tax=Kocuria oxytropis TaxID=3058913 RepID=UPI0034D6F12E
MTSTPRTSKGRPVTENQIERLAREAEAGYDPAELRRSGGRRPIGSAAARVVPVRLDPELDAALKQRAQADNTTASEVIRDALHAWLKST